MGSYIPSTLTQQEEMLINEFAVWNRLLTMKEMQYYYTGSLSKDYAAKHQMKEPVPIVDNIEEAIISLDEFPERGAERKADPPPERGRG